MTDAVDVTGGEHFFCALRKNATVVCWGDGTLGQLGQGDSRKELQRPVAPKGLVAVVAIAAGRQHACAARDDGRVLCWGLGGGGPGNDSPTLVRGLDRVVELAAGEDTTCARRESGEVWCWGSAPVPAPARGDPVTRLRLGRALPGIDDAVQIAVGADNVCARRATGKIACFSR